MQVPAIGKAAGWRGRSALALAATLAVGSLAAGCGGDDDGGEAGSGDGGLDQVEVQLDWVPRGNHAPFWVGQEQGFFADHGIEVTNVQEGTGSADAMRIVGQGGADFGFGDLPTLATARSQNVPVRALAAVNQRSPLAFCTKAERFELTEPADLEGLTMAVDPGQSTHIFSQAFIAANEIDSESIEERTVQPPYENFLLEDRVDVVPCYIDAEVPVLEESAGGEGSLSIMLGADHGYEGLGSGLFTSDELISDDPDLVERFTAAYLESLRWVIDNPEEAAALLAGTSQELAESEPVFIAQLEADIEESFTSEVTAENGLGYMGSGAWEETVRILSDQDVLNQPVEPEDAYDNSFAEEAGVDG